MEPFEIFRGSKLFAAPHRSAKRSRHQRAKQSAKYRACSERGLSEEPRVAAGHGVVVVVKTIRLAEAKRLAAKPGVKHPAEDLVMPELPDYVLTVEGDEPLRILRDAKEDLHDTIFLELENGGTLDLAGVKFVEDGDTDVVRTELHFARLLNGEPAIDPESDRVIFHCRANAKKEIPGRVSALSFRVEFSPKTMKALGQSDL